MDKETTERLLAELTAAISKRWEQKAKVADMLTNDRRAIAALTRIEIAELDELKTIDAFMTLLHGYGFIQMSQFA